MPQLDLSMNYGALLQLFHFSIPLLSRCLVLGTVLSNLILTIEFYKLIKLDYNILVVNSHHNSVDYF